MKCSSIFLLSILFVSALCSMQENQMNQVHIDEHIARLQKSLRNLELNQHISNQLQDTLRDELQAEIEHFEKIKREQLAAQRDDKQDLSDDVSVAYGDCCNDFAYKIN